MRSFERLGYIADRSLATAVYLITRLRKPLLIEGHAGLGKTEVAKILAAMLGTQLIRLQCYEGLDVSSSVYEWNYQKQLLAIKIQEGTGQTVEEKERHIFSREFLAGAAAAQIHPCSRRFAGAADRRDRPRR